MKTDFEIVSYVGAKPLLFGMTEPQVQGLVGLPLSTRLDNLMEKNAQYESFSLSYSRRDDRLVEIGFSKSANVSILGLEPFRDKGAFSMLLQKDSCPYEHLGFVILLDLGITLTGFHDDDPSQLAVTAFTRGRWDRLKSKFKKFQESPSSGKTGRRTTFSAALFAHTRAIL